MSFKYEKNARNKGSENIVFGLVIIAALCVLPYYAYAPVALHIPSYSQENVALVIIWLVFNLLGLGLIFQGVALLKFKGVWLVEISDGGINWATPNDGLGTSFRYRLDEIDKIVIEINRRKSSSAGYIEYQNYFIITKQGDRQKLYTDSGISLKMVITKLQELGIKKEVVNNSKFINIPFLFPNKAKVDLRLLANDSDIGNEISIEVENISNHPIKLDSKIVTVFFENKTNVLMPLNLTDNQLIISPFYPIPIKLSINDEVNFQQLNSIQYIEFKLVGDQTMKVKLNS